MKKVFPIACLCLNYWGLSPVLFADEARLTFEQIRQRIDQLDSKLLFLLDQKLSPEAPPKVGERPLPANMDPSGPKSTHPDLYKGPLAAPSEDVLNTVNDNHGIPKVGKANARIDNSPVSNPPDNSKTSANEDIEDLKKSINIVVSELQRSKHIIQKLKGDSTFSYESVPSTSHSSINSSQSRQGKIGSYHIGFSYHYAQNKDYDVASHTLALFGRMPFKSFVDLHGGIGFGWADEPAGFASDINSDRSFFNPSHIRYDFGAGIGLTLHKKFALHNSFVNSIDPYVTLGLPFDYYFETDYLVSAFRYGYQYAFGVEFIVFNKFSLIPGYGNGKSWITQETGYDSGSIEIESGWTSLELCYLFSDGDIFSMDLWQSTSSGWKGIIFNYRMAM